MARFATVAEYADYFGLPEPEGDDAVELAGRLTRASGRVLTILRRLGGRAKLDPATGMPSTETPLDQKVARALREATCEQAKHMDDTGEAADGTPFAGGSFGPLTLKAADGGTEGSDPRYSVNAEDVLRSAGLTSTRVRG